MCDPFNVPAISCPTSEKKSNKFCPEIKGGILISSCNCGKRNGLQMECRRSDCQGKVNRRQNNSNNGMNQLNNSMTTNCTHHSYENPSMTSPVCPEIISNETSEHSPQIPHDMPPESALKPEELSDVVYVDYGHNPFPDGNMPNMMNQMHAPMNQAHMQKMSSPQMMSQVQMMPTQVQTNHGTGDQKGQQISTMMATPQSGSYYPQINMPQNMSIPHVQMGDGKSIEIMNSMPQTQNFSMPGYNMMQTMPQNFNYYPMMQGQVPMMQSPMMQAPMQAMTMENYAQMQNSSQN